MNHREIVVNILLGLLLLLIFAIIVAIPVVVAVAVVGYLAVAIDPPLAHYFSSWGLPENTWYFLLICVFSLWNSIWQLRKRYWPNAVLSLAIVPMIAARWFAGPLFVDASPSRFGALWTPPLFILCLIPSGRRLHRWEFVLGTLIVSVGTASNAGLLGAGAPARLIAQFALPFGVLAWLAVLNRTRADAPSSNGLAPTLR